MNAIRSWIGIADGPSTAASADAQRRQTRSAALLQEASTSSRSDTERLAALERAQKVQLGALQEEFEEITAELKAIDISKHRQLAMKKLQERKRIEAEMDMLSKKLANTRGQLKIVQNAKSNLEQSVAIKEGAVELQAVAMAIEQLDMQQSVDDIQEAVAELNEHERVLTMPLFATGGHNPVVSQYNAEQELAALMAEQGLNALPSVPTGAATAAPVVDVASPPAAAASAAAAAGGAQDALEKAMAELDK